MFLFLSRYLPGSKTLPQNSAEVKKLGGVGLIASGDEQNPH